MSIQPFDVIELSGTPFEIGREHGERAGTLINNSVVNYKKMFKELVGLDWAQVKALAEDYIEPIHNCDPDILEELHGIACGSGLTLEDIVAVNARTELIYSNAMGDVEGCTAVAVMPEKTECKRMLMGQNWDYRPMVANSLVILKIKQSGKPDIIMVTEAGMVGKIGFNSKGICTGLNALSAPSVPKGVPVHVALRLLLNGENLTQGASFLEHTPVAGCGNIVLGSAGGYALNLEIGPDDYDVLTPKNGLLVHANHYLSERFSHYRGAKGERTINSYLRQDRMQRIFENTAHPATIDDFKRAFSDHSDYPDSICRHPEPKHEPSAQAATLYSVIFDLERLEMHLCRGNPCVGEYEVFSLNEKN